MPSFAKADIQEFELPSSTPDDKALASVDLTVYGGQAEDIFDSAGQLKRPVSSILAGAIKSWNFVDDSGAIAPITTDNVRRLSPEDFNFLSEKVLPKLNVVATAQVQPAEKKV